jgi:hypothetical protein
MTSGQLDTIQLEPDQVSTESGEIEYATLEVTNASGSALAQIDSQGNVSLLGELNAATISAETASISGELTARSARLEQLEARMAEFESVKAQTADLVDATISGTLYATKIDGLDDKMAETMNQESFLDKLLTKKEEKITESGLTASNSAKLNSLASIFSLTEDAGYATDSGTLTSDSSLFSSFENNVANDVTLSASAVFINNYFAVNGSGYIAQQLGVGEQLLIGSSLALGRNFIEFQPIDPAEPRVLHLQPSGQGSLSLLAGLMTLDENGQVLIDGDLAVAGKLEVGDTLLTNLIEPTQFGDSLQFKLATRSGDVAGTNTEDATDSGQITESRFEILNQDSTPTATISAQGRGSFAQGINIGSEDLTEVSTQSATIESKQPSGKATVRQNTLGITIKSQLVTKDSLIYVSPLGSTNNQVLYVKTQTEDKPNTLEQEGGFTVGFDVPASRDVQFNWWIVN